MWNSREPKKKKSIKNGSSKCCLHVGKCLRLEWVSLACLGSPASGFGPGSLTVDYIYVVAIGKYIYIYDLYIQQVFTNCYTLPSAALGGIQFVPP